VAERSLSGLLKVVREYIENVQERLKQEPRMFPDYKELIKTELATMEWLAYFMQDLGTVTQMSVDITTKKATIRIMQHELGKEAGIGGKAGSKEISFYVARLTDLGSAVFERKGMITESITAIRSIQSARLSYSRLGASAGPQEATKV